MSTIIEILTFLVGEPPSILGTDLLYVLGSVIIIFMLIAFFDIIHGAIRR